MATATARTASRLGWAGLLPFLAAPLAVSVSTNPAEIVGPAIAAYSLAIVCFLMGAWWGIALLRQAPVILVASNVVVIAACLGFVLLGLRANLLLQALLLAGAIVVERMHPMFGPQPDYYATLRLRLSAVASLALMLSVLQLPA
ncbi:DUF3429 family protein [Halioglobus maricola]|uniref:DUF3429 family protein n=1 Tax=Halioglobus maricola TaxID=2601894 RepID=A0A5P9NNC9_9GAMM|nr:DUF3429 domain-containing protein [Halioglobus maricola]QFU76774.1 DUF3429 family protein [Halioglobus maricola]